MPRKINAEIFGIDTSDLEQIDKENIEEVIFEYGNVQYKIGRLETDGKETEKDYNKLVKRKEKLTEIIGEFFKNQ